MTPSIFSAAKAVYLQSWNFPPISKNLVLIPVLFELHSPMTLCAPGAFLASHHCSCNVSLQRLPFFKPKVGMRLSPRKQTRQFANGGSMLSIDCFVCDLNFPDFPCITSFQFHLWPLHFAFMHSGAPKNTFQFNTLNLI
jgi:hypothetical protein